MDIDTSNLPVKSLIYSYHPIMDTAQRVVAYEVQSHHADTAPSALNYDSSAIINAFLHTGMNDLFRGRPVFVRVTAEFLLSELPLLLPAERVVFQMSVNSELPASLDVRLAFLKSHGYRIALDDFLPDKANRSILNYTSFIKTPVSTLDVRETIRVAHNTRVQCIATGVDTPAQLDFALDCGFDAFEGSYFAKPREGHESNANSKLDVLDLIAKLNNDGSDRDIEEFFKSHPGLALHLLHLVNSASTGHNIQISSIRQALSLLGRCQMLGWFQLLLYSLDDRYAVPNPLMAAAAWRGKFMELMVRYAQSSIGSNLQDQAYMVGMLSMTDALLDMSILDIMPRLNLSKEISEAILEGSGVLGRLLMLAETLQFKELDLVENLARKDHYKIDAVMYSQNEALAWVQRFQSHPAENTSGHDAAV